MATPPLTRTEQQRRTRERLLDAAAHVFARRGYHAATLAEVASEAGFSTGAVYSNFDGKEDLFLALADRQLSGRAEEARAVAEAAGDPERFQAAIADWFEGFADRNEDWPLLFYEFWSYGTRTQSLRSAFAARRKRARDAIAEPLEVAADELGLRPRYAPKELAAALGAVINGLGFERAIEPDVLSDELVAFVIVAVLRAGLGAGPEGPDGSPDSR
jgi:AcrR family transcriptional regulator